MKIDNLFQKSKGGSQECVDTHRRNCDLRNLIFLYVRKLG